MSLVSLTATKLISIHNVFSMLRAISRYAPLFLENHSTFFMEILLRDVLGITLITLMKYLFSLLGVILNKYRSFLVLCLYILKNSVLFNYVLCRMFFFILLQRYITKKYLGWHSVQGNFGQQRECSSNIRQTCNVFT